MKDERGVTIVEVLMVLLVAMIVFNLFLGVIIFSMRTFSRTEDMQIANNLIKNGFEKVREVRDRTDWDEDGLGSLERDVSYIIYDDEILKGKKEIDYFSKEIIFKDVRRDTEDMISDEGSLDPDSVEVVIRIKIDEEDTVSVSSYLTNWKR